MTQYAIGDKKPSLSSGTWIAHNATVIGDVRLGANASIWFGAVLRGDNEPIRIGRRTNIQENVVIHTDPGLPVVLGAEVTVGHTAMLHGCTVEDGALIGIGAIVLNGARVGAGAIIGAGALVPENKTIPPGAVVFGSPGKVMRQVSEAERARIAEGVADYDARWRRYKRGLKPQT